MKSLVIAFAMYSKLPMPRVEWDEKSLSRALWWFPAVGLAAGGLLWLWLRLSQLLGLSTVLCAAGALLLPVAVSGGIHLDGFCDTCDALSSHQSRERKLEILKDSHTGAFAIICCCLYLICFFAVWCEALPAGRETWCSRWARCCPGACRASLPPCCPTPGAAGCWRPSPRRWTP